MCWCFWNWHRHINFPLYVLLRYVIIGHVSVLMIFWRVLGTSYEIQTSAKYNIHMMRINVTKSAMKYHVLCIGTDILIFHCSCNEISYFLYYHRHIHFPLYILLGYIIIGHMYVFVIFWRVWEPHVKSTHLPNIIYIIQGMCWWCPPGTIHEYVIFLYLLSSFLFKQCGCLALKHLNNITMSYVWWIDGASSHKSKYIYLLLSSLKSLSGGQLYSPSDVSYCLSPSIHQCWIHSLDHSSCILQKSLKLVHLVNNIGYE